MANPESSFYRKSSSRRASGAPLRKLLRNRRLLVLLAIGVPLLGYVIFGNKGVVQRIRLTNEKAEIEARIRTAQTDSIALRAEAKALDNDTKAIEKAAREKHNLVRDGEQVYRVRPEQ